MRKLGIYVFMLLFSLFISVLMAGASSAIYSNLSNEVAPLSSRTITVPDDYPTMQAAINAASDGETVFVRNGTHYENVVVNKQVKLLGENQGGTIIAANATGIVLNIWASNVSVSGFTIKGSGSTSPDSGVLLQGVANCSIFGNRIIGNLGDGIFLIGCSNNVIFGNEVVGNDVDGISVSGSTRNTISDNNVTGNGWSGIGLFGYSSDNNVTSNNVVNNPEGIALVISAQNEISGNTIVSNSNWGISIYQSLNNTIFHNEFNNSLQANSDGSLNMWDDGYPSGGNYWSNYNGTDLYSGPCQNITGSDGVGDDKYVIDSNNTDNYPLMKPYPWNSHDVGVTFIGEVEYPIYVVQKTFIWNSSILRFDAFIMNYGDSIESTNVTAYANGTIIDHVYNVTIASHNSTILDMHWNTTGFLLGYYNITVYTEPVIGESDLADNARSIWMHVYIFGDINGDGKVDIRDLAAIAKAFGQTVPPANPDLDVNQDWKIDIRDIAVVAKHFGEHL
jgi:parallel beta-helix repeat protein